MNKVKNKIIIHIGQHKTGSKALQAYLSENCIALQECGFYYPIKDANYKKIAAYKNSHYRLYTLLRFELIKAANDTKLEERFWRETKDIFLPHLSVRSMLDSCLFKRARKENKTLLLSAEDLFDMHSAHEINFSIDRVISATRVLSEILCDLNYSPTFVVYLRRQDHLLAAHYAQYIKGSAVNCGSFFDFEKQCEPRLRSWEILSHWISVFGLENIIVRTYEPLRNNFDIVQDFFESILRCSLPVKMKCETENIEHINKTPDRDYIEFMRILNDKTTKKLTVFCRDKVLKSAFSDCTRSAYAKGISAWMSPEEQKTLLKKHELGNKKIMDLFFRDREALFLEPILNKENWQPYGGLTAERAIAIALTSQNTACPRIFLSCYLWIKSFLKAFR